MSLSERQIGKPNIFPCLSPSPARILHCETVRTPHFKGEAVCPKGNRHEQCFPPVVSELVLGMCACVWQSKDQDAHTGTYQGEKRIPVIVFDYCFLGSEGRAIAAFVCPWPPRTDVVRTWRSSRNLSLISMGRINLRETSTSQIGSAKSRPSHVVVVLVGRTDMLSNISAGQDGYTPCMSDRRVRREAPLQD